MPHKNTTKGQRHDTNKPPESYLSLCMHDLFLYSPSEKGNGEETENGRIETDWTAGSNATVASFLPELVGSMGMRGPLSDQRAVVGS